MTLTWVNEGRCYPVCKDGDCCLLLRGAYFSAIGEGRSELPLPALPDGSFERLRTAETKRRSLTRPGHHTEVGRSVRVVRSTGLLPEMRKSHTGQTGRHRHMTQLADHFVVQRNGFDYNIFT
jgi:hypothetical protein